AAILSRFRLRHKGGTIAADARGPPATAPAGSALEEGGEQSLEMVEVDRLRDVVIAARLGRARNECRPVVGARRDDRDMRQTFDGADAARRLAAVDLGKRAVQNDEAWQVASGRLDGF